MGFYDSSAFSTEVLPLHLGFLLQASLVTAHLVGIDLGVLDLLDAEILFNAFLVDLVGLLVFLRKFVHAIHVALHQKMGDALVGRSLLTTAVDVLQELLHAVGVHVRGEGGGHRFFYYSSLTDLLPLFFAGHRRRRRRRLLLLRLVGVFHLNLFDLVDLRFQVAAVRKFRDRFHIRFWSVLPFKVGVVIPAGEEVGRGFH